MPAVCWHPDTDPSVIDAFYHNPKRIPELGIYPRDPNKFQIANRWTSTAFDGSGLSQGDPTTITWSFMPDGTDLSVSNACGEGALNSDSDLIAFLDAQFGAGQGGTDLTMRPWFIHFQVVFDRWEELTGLTYMYEPNDDGAPLDFANPGILNVRGDVRIGGENVDGNGGILACNFFADFGDMVIDTNDDFYNANNIPAFQNVISHEHGHGLGFAHSCPVTETKLMEPFVSVAFDGPQEDDILAGHQSYGDPNGRNDSPALAKDLGTVTIGNSLIETLVSIDNTNENDYYSFNVSSTDLYSITVNPTGTTFLSGPQLAGGACDPGADFNAMTQSDLGVELLDTDGATILATANSEGLGFEEIICNIMLGSGTYFIRVFGNGSVVQLYDLEIEQGSMT